jgi:hypothetical protein
MPVDSWIARSTAEAYELPEHVAARRARAAARNAPGVWRAAVRRRVLSFVDRNLEALFWPAVALLLAAAVGVYFILENLGWFGL